MKNLITALVLLTLITGCTKKYITRHDLEEFAQGSATVAKEQANYICMHRAQMAGDQAVDAYNNANNVTNCYGGNGSYTCKEGSAVRGGSMQAGMIQGISEGLNKDRAFKDASQSTYDMCVAEYGYRHVVRKELNPNYKHTPQKYVEQCKAEGHAYGTKDFNACFDKLNAN